jgi:hypothetical protein
VSSAIYFSNLLEYKDKRLKIKLTLKSDSTSQPKARRLLHMEYEFNRTPYKEDCTTTQGKSTSQPRCSQESTRTTPSRRSLEELEDAFRSTRTRAVLGYEELGGLSDPGTRDCPCGTLLLGYRMGYGPRPIFVVTTRNVVGLLVQS